MSHSQLFAPLRLGRSQLQHRVVMAPLTRYRASSDHVPSPLMAEYYAQRASIPGTQLITEATFISASTAGYANTPGIYNEEQIRAWKTVTDAVHAKGSFINVQLWHLGRAADPVVLADKGFEVVSSSDTPIDKTRVTPVPLTVEQIKGIVQDFAQAAKNAIAAGFDGVELHGANGYLIDQFLQDTSNKRTDEYGGSIENRSRFGLEVAQAVADAIGADRLGFRISPFSPFQGMKMADPVPQFRHLVENLKPLKLSYLHVVESRISGNLDVQSAESVNFAIDAWAGTSPVLLAGGFKPELAIKAVAEDYKGKDVAIVFGRYFISNPDLPFRIKTGVELINYDRNTFYKPGSPEGYTSYPFSEEWKAAAKLIESKN